MSNQTNVHKALSKRMMENRKKFRELARKSAFASAMNGLRTTQYEPGASNPLENEQKEIYLEMIQSVDESKEYAVYDREGLYYMGIFVMANDEKIAVNNQLYSWQKVGAIIPTNIYVGNKDEVIGDIDKVLERLTYAELEEFYEELKKKSISYEKFGGKFNVSEI